jgi:hypothetical protein
MITTVYLLLAALTLGTPLPHVTLAPAAGTLPLGGARQLGFAVVELDTHSMTIRFYDGEGNAISKPFRFQR